MWSCRRILLMGLQPTTPDREGSFPALLTKRYCRHGPDRTSPTIVPRREPLRQIVIAWRVTSRLPSPALSYHCPPRIFRTKLTRPKDGAVLRAVKDVRAQHHGGVKTPRDERAGGRCGPHCETALPHASLPIYTRFVSSSRASVIVVPHLARSI
jgi:hypothetical protein